MLDNLKRTFRAQEKIQEEEKERVAERHASLTIWNPPYNGQTTGRGIFENEVKATVLKEISAIRSSTQDNLKLYNISLAKNWHSLTDEQKGEYGRKAIERNEIQRGAVDDVARDK